MNSKRVMQFLSIFALMVWGGVFVYFYLTPAADGTGPLIQKYVNANKNFDLWVLIAGMGLFVLAIFNLITFKQKSGICNHDHAHGDACDHDHQGHNHGHDHGDDDHVHTEACDHDHDHKKDHDHGHEEDHNHDHEQTTAGLAFSILILVVPVLVAANYSEGRFSPDYFRKLTQIETKMRAMEIEKKGGAVIQQTTMAEVKAAEDAADTPPNPNDEASSDVAEFSMEDLKKMVPQNDAGSFMLEVPEIYYTAGDQQLMKVLEGVPVEFTAQVMNETVNNEAGNRLRAFRLLVECCAADARPISMPLEFSEKLPEFEEMGWFKMTGKLHYAKENDEWVPMLRVMEFDQTAEQIEMLY